MPNYLFTSDLRISELSARIKNTASLTIEGKPLPSDKSDNNNATTLRFYFNLFPDTETCSKAGEDPLFVIRNFVLKFQFPNVRTPESFSDSLSSRILFAPFRSVVSVLFHMANYNNNGCAWVSLDEILYHLFCNKDVYLRPTFDPEKIIQLIERGRTIRHDYSKLIQENLSWNQYERQARELFTVLTYASSCFKLSNSIISFNTKASAYEADKEFIKQIVNYRKFWYPSTPDDFKRSTSEYIKYMDTKETSYSIIDFNLDAVPALPDERLQVIYYGAPGTGKSFQLEKDTKSFNHIRTIFHPDSDYASFVGCYKPVMNGDKIKYDFRAQAFINAYVNAWLSKDPYYLIIEEINRGNCAQIFGDIFQLLDRKNGVSDYTVVPDADLKNYLHDTFHSEENQAIIKEKGLDIPNDILDGTGMRLPANFFLRATMNTSDQSLFPMDSAFKRRWAWKHFSIKDEGKGYKIEVDENHVYDWWKTIDTLNRKIYGETKSADKQIGYWFAKLPDNVTVISKDDFVSKVLFYLWNDVFKDYGFDSKNAFSEEIQFDKFFTSDGKVDASMVVKFMENNGIKPEEKESSEDSAEEEQQ